MIHFVVSAFIVKVASVLLLNHKKLQCWLPVGGHMEDEETPNQALAREIREECGLILGENVHPVERRRRMDIRLDIADNHNRVSQLRPWALETHDFAEGHRHNCLVYLLKTIADVQDGGEELRWFSTEDLEKVKLLPSIRIYSEFAIQKAQNDHF